MAAEAAGLPTGNDALPAPEDAGKGTSARHWEKGKGRVAHALRMRPHGRRRPAGPGTADDGEAESRTMGGASASGRQGFLSALWTARFFAPPGFGFLEGPGLQGSNSETKLE